ncbi:MAG: flavin reductase family protein [Acidimicrobiia bacterium]
MPDDVVLSGVAEAAVRRRGFDAARFRQVLGHFCTGVVVVTGLAEAEPIGFTVQSFTSVSLDPPLVTVCPARTSATWPRLRSAGGFCANVLASDQEALGRVFATAGGDHLIVVARVLDLGVGGSGRPLLFYRGGYGRFEP